MNICNNNNNKYFPEAPWICFCAISFPTLYYLFTYLLIKHDERRGTQEPRFTFLSSWGRAQVLRGGVLCSQYTKLPSRREGERVGVAEKESNTAISANGMDLMNSGVCGDVSPECVLVPVSPYFQGPLLI